MPRDRRVYLAIGLLALLAFPFVTSDPYLLHVGVLALIFAVLASTWDLTLGYAGVFNFAHIAFFALGAYASGVASVRLDVDPWIGLLLGAIVAAVAAVAAYMPVYRLRGIYVALITFAFSQLCLHLVVSQSDITGGFNGLVGLPPLAVVDGGRSPVQAYLLALLLLVLSTLFLRRLVNSDFGLSLRAAGTFEHYAASRGVPISRQRILAFVASAVFSGAAGAFYAHYLGVVSPELFSFSFSALILSMVLVGGLATTYGPIAAAIILTFASELLASLGPWRFILVAVLMVAVMLFAPSGLWGLTTRVRSRLSAREQRAPTVPSE